MTRIDPAAQLAMLIRSQVDAAWRARSHTPPRPPKLDPKLGAPSPGLPSPSAEALVALRVRAIAADDPQRQRKAFRIFLASTLLQAFGTDHVNDPAFDELVDTVLRQMETDAALNAALLAAGEHLLASSAL